ncbi:FAD-dependent oxidoreductase [Luminiphilus sp.]|nr:FAD-dependent oxidoreductase [Luminiphilus sp.]
MTGPSYFFLQLLLQIQALTQASPGLPETYHDVIVVGAGSAGLYATRTLQEYGYEVLLIEATDRIGGRVKSATLGDIRVELGAEEHYLGAGGNPVWPAIRAEYGNSVYTNAYEGLEAYSMDQGAGTCWTTPLALNPCANDPDVARVSEFYDWYWQPDLHQDATTSVADDLLAAFGVGEGHRAYHLYDEGIAGGSYATNLTRLGARSLALQDSQWALSSGIRVLSDKALGYADALQTVWWDEVLADVDLLLSSPVVSIDTSGDGVVATDIQGRRHSARHIVVTVSVGVLQAEAIDFIPDLPETTVRAYNAIGIDSGMKVPLRFRSAWWETESEPLGWLVTEGVAGACWAPSNYKTAANSFVLMCYPMGDNAKALSERAAGQDGAGDATIINAILQDLDNTFPQAPGAASANFIEGLVQDWGSAPYTLGVYSFPVQDTYLSSSNNKRRDLRGPVADDRIFFAGEATHEENPATVVGALQEGERAALAIHAINGQISHTP